MIIWRYNCVPAVRGEKSADGNASADDTDCWERDGRAFRTAEGRKSLFPKISVEPYYTTKYLFNWVTRECQTVNES